MEISIATDWDDKLIENLDLINFEYGKCVREIYGSLRFSVVGTVRPGCNLPNVSIDDAKRHIKLAHQKGIKFNYTFNATCTGGIEYHEKTHRQILELLDNIMELEIDSIVVALPYYLELIKNRYPNLYTKVSVMAHTDSLTKMRQWEDIGADCIVVCDSLNRDFEMLRRFKEEAKCDLEILAGNCCLHTCAYQYYHNTLVSHMSQTVNNMKGMYVDYPVLRCVYRKLQDPTEIIRARWIRPEDIKEYEAIGYNVFKLGARQSSTEWLTKVVRAYASRNFDGNLLTLLQGFEPIAYLDKKKENGINEEHWNMFQSGLENFKDFNSLLYLDNNKLNGFLEHFKTNPCRSACIKCNYCKSFADKAIHAVDQERLDTFLETCKFVLGGLVNSEILFE